MMASNHNDNLLSATSRLLPVVCVILAVHFLLLITAESIPAHKLVFLALFSSIVFLPGFLMVSIIFPAARIYYKIFLALCAGTALTFFWLIIFDLLSLDIYYISFVTPALSILLAAWKDYGSFTGYPFPNNQTLSVPVLVILTLVIIYVTIVTVAIGDPVIYTGDSPDHIAYIRTISRSHEVFPDPFLYREGGMLTRDIRKGLFHSIWGTVNTVAGRIEAYPVWPLFSWMGSVFLLLGIFCLGVQFFGKQSIAVTGVILYLLYYRGGQAGHQLVMNGYAYYFGKIFMFASLMLTPAFLRTGRRDLLFIIALSSFAAVGTHISHIMIIPFGISIFILFEYFQSTDRQKNSLLKRRLPLIAASILLVNLPYLLIRFFRDYNPVNEIHTHVHGMMFLTDSFAIVNPILFFLSNGYLMAVSFFAVFILWKRSGEDRNLRLLLGLTASVYLLVFNPLWVKPIMDRITYLIIRFASAAPAMLITAYLLHSLLDNFRERGRRTLSRRASFAGCIVTAVLLIPPFFSNFTDFIYCGEKRTSVEKESVFNLSDLYSEIEESIPPGSVIASDPNTSYCIPAFCDQYVVCTFDQHSIPNDSTALERIMDCRDIYLPSVPCGEVTDILRRYGAGYVVINGRIPESVMGDYWRPDREVAEEAFRKLLGCGDNFELLYESDYVYLFRFNKEAGLPSETTEGQLRHSDDRLRGHFSGGFEHLTGSETEGIYIGGWGKNRDVIKRGDTLTIYTEWITDRELPAGSYTVHIRFDTDFEKGFLYREEYGKVYRKIREKIEGKRYRFRISRLPFEGLYPPDKWPVGRVIREYTSIQVPRNISAGTYTVSVKMHRAPHKANYRIKDLLTDDDVYDGPDLMKVVIE